MLIDCNTGGGTVTVSEADPLSDWKVAVIVAEPAFNVVAKPEAFRVATVVSDELHVAEVVTSLVLLSLYFAVAEYCCVLPSTTDVLPGLTVTDCKVGGAAVTLSDAVPLSDWKVAVMVAVPAFSVVARPDAFTVATVASDELHADELVTSFEVPSLNLADAESCCVTPATTDGLLGLTLTDCTVGGGGVLVEELVPPPHPTNMTTSDATLPNTKTRSPASITQPFREPCILVVI